MLDQALNLLSWALLLSGSFFVIVGGIGSLRMPDLYTRMHAASVTDSMAPILILSALMLQAGLSLYSVKLAAILVFLLLTGPTASNALASTALLSNRQKVDEEHL